MTYNTHSKSVSLMRRAQDLQHRDHNSRRGDQVSSSQLEDDLQRLDSHNTPPISPRMQTQTLSQTQQTSPSNNALLNKLAINKPSALNNVQPEELAPKKEGIFQTLVTQINWNITFWISFGLLLITCISTFVLVNNFGALPLSLSILFISIAGFSQFLNLETIKQSNEKNCDKLRQQIEDMQDKNWEFRESEERYRSLSEAFGDLMMHRSPDGVITYVNDGFASTFGLPHGHFIGKPFTISFVEEIQRSNPNQHANIREVKVETKKGELWFAWLDLTVRDQKSGQPYLRTMARDITRQKQIEIDLREAHQKAEAASHAKTRFLANVSHEMRTPLNGILGMSGLVSDTTLTPEQKTYIGAIHESGTALLSLIEDILDISRVESGKLELKAKQVNVLRMVEDVCELIASRAQDKEISISSYISPTIPKIIEIDAGKLRQVLINLIGNAVKFTEQGGVHIRLTNSLLTTSASNAKQLLFEVIDTGPGISKEDQRKIFDEFEQVDSANTREHGGAGLGLAISQRIVEEMGSKISIDSTIGSGSNFSFDIEVPFVHEIIDGDYFNQLKHYHVAILENDNFDSIKQYIQDYGGSSFAISSINHLEDEKAIEDLANCDVILVDHKQLSSPDEITNLRKHLQRKKTQVIIMLDIQQRHLLEDYLNLGVDGYLIKPIRKDSLLNVISGKYSAARDDEKTITTSKGANQDELLNLDTPRRILIAEDNEINAMLSRAILEKSGHLVERAKDGDEAIKIWKNHKGEENFDLIFMDLHMPVKDGMDALMEIRNIEHETGTPPIPIFILTADEQVSTREMAIKAGANGFLIKPLDPQKLLSAASQLSA